MLQLSDQSSREGRHLTTRRRSLSVDGTEGGGGTGSLQVKGHVTDECGSLLRYHTSLTQVTHSHPHKSNPFTPHTPFRTHASLTISLYIVWLQVPHGDPALHGLARAGPNETPFVT